LHLLHCRRRKSQVGVKREIRRTHRVVEKTLSLSSLDPSSFLLGFAEDADVIGEKRARKRRRNSVSIKGRERRSSVFRASLGTRTFARRRSGDSLRRWRGASNSGPLTATRRLGRNRKVGSSAMRDRGRTRERRSRDRVPPLLECRIIGGTGGEMDVRKIPNEVVSSPPAPGRIVVVAEMAHDVVQRARDLWWTMSNDTIRTKMDSVEAFLEVVKAKPRSEEREAYYTVADVDPELAP
jgi:hypothetical protein